MKSNYAKRTLSGLIYMFLFSLSIFSGHLYLNLFLLLVTFIGLYEFANIIKYTNIYRWGFLYLISTLIFIANYFIAIGLDVFDGIHSLIFYFIILSIFIYFIFEAFNVKVDFSNNIGGMFVAIFMIVFPICLLIQLSFIEGYYNPFVLLYFLLLVSVNDTFAFIFGSLLGKTKIIKRISPQKTLEGYIGAFIATFMFSFFFREVFSNHIEFLNYNYSWLILFFIVVIFGSIGDLVESSIKRKANVKDSGNIIIGHGGIMDRFDSLLFSTPFFYTFIKIIY